MAVGRRRSPDGASWWAAARRFSGNLDPNEMARTPPEVRSKAQRRSRSAAGDGALIEGWWGCLGSRGALIPGSDRAWGTRSARGGGSCGGEDFRPIVPFHLGPLLQHLQHLGIPTETGPCRDDATRAAKARRFGCGSKNIDAQDARWRAAREVGSLRRGGWVLGSPWLETWLRFCWVQACAAFVFGGSAALENSRWVGVGCSQ